MHNAHVDISQGLDGEPVVFACFDLNEEQIAASTHAIAVTVVRALPQHGHVGR